MPWSAREIVGAPIYAAEILTKQKSFSANPVIGSSALNRRGLHVWRVKLANRIAAARRKRLERLVSAADRAEFDRNGFVEKQGFLDPEHYRKLLAELKSMKGPGREMVEGRAVTRRIAITPELVATMPALRAFLERPEWTGLTRYIGGFDAEPSMFIETIFGAVAEGGQAADPQTELHMDTFHPTMKAWYFLEDVALDEGPFNYVPGSHALTRERLDWHQRTSVAASEGANPALRHGSFRVADAELPAIGLGPRREFAVPGNTLVVADTFGFHARGKSLRPSVRVEIHAALRPNPFSPFVGLDVARIPFLRGRKQLIGWWFDDALAALGLKRPAMRDVGLVNPWEPPRSATPAPAAASTGTARA